MNNRGSLPHDQGIQPTDNWREGYRNIEKAYKEGKVKAIGLSNFPEALLKEAIETMEIKPQVVQVEAHPYFPQTELKKLLTEYDMGLMAAIAKVDKGVRYYTATPELIAQYAQMELREDV